MKLEEAIKKVLEEAKLHEHLHEALETLEPVLVKLPKIGPKVEECAKGCLTYPMLLMWLKENFD